MKTIEKKIDRVNVRIEKFNGIDELLRFVENTPADKGFDDIVNGERKIREEFHGAKTYKDARGDLKKGVNIKEVIGAINTGERNYDKKRNVRHISGGAACVPAAVSSDPRAMYQKRRDQITGAYDIFINCTYHCGITSQQVKEAGLKILQEVMRVATIKPVNLYMGTTLIDQEGRNVIGYGMQIIDAGKSFNAARVSYALTEAGFFRVFGFAYIVRNRGMWSSNNNFGLGRVLSLYNNNLNDKVMRAAYKNMIYVDMVDVIRHGSAALNELEAIK